MRRARSPPAARKTQHFTTVPNARPSRAASLHIEYPMLFKVENAATGRTTHCGVLEFIAEEGHVYLPRWVRPPSIWSREGRTIDPSCSVACVRARWRVANL